MKRHTSLTLLAGGTLILAIAAAAWWISSPQGVRRAGEAIVLLAGMVGALAHVRRVPSASPAVLFTTVIGGLVVIARPGGPLFPIALCVSVAITWAIVSITQSSALRALPKILTTVFLRTYGPAVRSGNRS
jgi:hypothetical protein